MLANICEKHKILEKCWLRTMYEKQQFWIPCYLNDVFFCWYDESGRGESINSYFDRYVNSNRMLNDFVLQYDKAVVGRHVQTKTRTFIQ